VIVQSNKVQTCYTRYANIYTFFGFLKIKKKKNWVNMCFLWLFVIGVVFLKRKEKEQQKNNYEK